MTLCKNYPSLNTLLVHGPKKIMMDHLNMNHDKMQQGANPSMEHDGHHHVMMTL